MVKVGGPPPIKSTVRDETAARAFGAEYQNNYGRPLLCIVTVQLERAAGADSACYVIAYADDSSPPTSQQMGHAGFYPGVDAVDKGLWCLTFAVPPGYYYQLNYVESVAGSAGAIIRWIEVEL